MRNPDRIKPFIKKLENYWLDNPDLRLGQIVANCIRAYDGRLNCDPFYIEDNELLNGLEKLDSKWGSNND